MSNRFALVGLSIVAGLTLPATTMYGQGNTSLSGQKQVNTITTAVPFLRISPDARSGAMGDVGLALSTDANAQYWNVARIPFASKKYGASATYTPWLRDLVPDISLIYVSGFSRFGQNNEQAISASLRYFSLGDINYTDFNAQPIGTGKPREFSFDLGYSRKLSEYLSTGLNLRYIHSSIASGLAGLQPGVDYKPGNAFAADLGFFYSNTMEIDQFRSNNLSFGAVLSNLGSRISYNSLRRDYLPANLGLGAAYTSAFDEYNKITFAVDVNKLLVPTPQLDEANSTPDQPRYTYPDKPVVSGIFSSFGDAPGGFSEEMREIQLSAGLEYWYQEQFAVRAGYFYEDKTKGDRKYFTCGLGVKYRVFNLNFAYLVPSGSGINRNPLANTIRFSLVFDFDSFDEGSAD